MNRKISGVETLFIPSATEHSLRGVEAAPGDRPVRRRRHRDGSRRGGQAPPREVRDDVQPRRGDRMTTDRPGQSPYESPQVESVLREIRDLIEQARPMPLSTSVMINQAEVLDLVDEAAERLPEELRAAKWLLKQREEFLARTRREAEEILDDAREKAEQMVRKTEVVKAAEARARSVDRPGRRRVAPPQARGRGLLRPAPRQLRDRARAHHEGRQRRSGQAPGQPDAGRRRRRRRRARRTPPGSRRCPITAASPGRRRSSTKTRAEPMARPLVVRVGDLLREPGSRRDLDAGRRPRAARDLARRAPSPVPI